MKPRSAKNKGNRYENHLIEILREKLDKSAHRTCGSGAGLDKQDIVLPAMGYEIEAKNQKTLKILDWWEQCKKQEHGNKAIVVFRNPRKAEFQENLVIMDLNDWIEVMTGQSEEVKIESNFKPSLLWKIKRLKDATNDVMKELNN